MIWSTPLVTQYESQYGPPQLEQAPNEMTYFGSGICSYSRRTAGAILSVTVPLTTIRSACRGPCANGITPSRMKSCRDIEVAMNSIAQQASPKLNTHRLYRRPQFNTNRIGSPSTPGSSAIPRAYCPLDRPPPLAPPAGYRPGVIEL